MILIFFFSFHELEYLRVLGLEKICKASLQFIG